MKRTDGKSLSEIIDDELKLINAVIHDPESNPNIAPELLRRRFASRPPEAGGILISDIMRFVDKRVSAIDPEDVSDDDDPSDDGESDDDGETSGDEADTPPPDAPPVEGAEFIPDGGVRREGVRNLKSGHCSACMRHMKSHRAFWEHAKRCSALNRRAPPPQSQRGLAAFGFMPAKTPAGTAAPRPRLPPVPPAPPAHQVPRTRAAMVEAVVEGNISINTAHRPAWRRFAEETGMAEMIVSDPDALRSDIEDGGRFYEEQVLRKLSGQRVVYAVDGSTVDPKCIYAVTASYQGMSGRRQQEFVRVFEYDEASGANIAADIAAMLQQHVARGVLPIGVVIDNGSNLVRAFDATQKDSVQALTGIKLVVGRCGVHTANRILVDAEGTVEGFPEFKSYVKATIKFLHRRVAKRALRRLGVTTKVPRVQEAKWNTFVIAATFIDEFRIEIAAVVAEHGGPAGDINAFRTILEALVPFRTFIEAIEGDNATLARGFDMMMRLQSKWAGMPDNQAARTFGQLLARRFDAEEGANPGTADGVLMDVAFSLHKRGHAEHLAMVQQIARGNPATASEDEGRQAEASIARLTAARAKFVELAGSIFPAKAEALGGEYQEYIATESAWAGGQDAPLGWAMKAWQNTFSREFVHVAQVITEFPVSEAVVERFFSVLTSIFDLRRRRSELDLIQAEMMIRMWQIHHPGDFAFVEVARE